MGTLSLSKWARLLGTLTIGMGLSAGSSDAGDHGYSYHAKVYQHGTLVGPTTYVGTGAYLTSTPLWPTAGLTMIPTQISQVVTPSHYLITSGVPTYSYAVTGAYSGRLLSSLPVPSSPLLKSSQTNTASPLLKSAGVLNPATVEYVAEYNTFLQQEYLKNPGSLAVAAGVPTHPADLVGFYQNHPQLVASMGPERLASIGRFLVTKRQDPNFRNNAVKLFEPIVGVSLPQYVPFIDRFLDDLGPGTVPPPNDVPSPIPAEPPGPAIPPPGARVPNPSASSGLLKNLETGHFVATDADAIRAEFDARMNLISVTRPDGKVFTRDANPTSTVAN